jgi:hypothetical protein
MAAAVGSTYASIAQWAGNLASGTLGNIREVLVAGKQ